MVVDTQGEEGRGTPLDQAEAPCSEQLLKSVSAGLLEVWGTEG